ncbi:MAG: bacteriocin [Treponema sp.]|nr:bacteriocin [Treponema sp.]
MTNFEILEINDEELETIVGGSNCGTSGPLTGGQ